MKHKTLLALFAAMLLQAAAFSQSNPLLKYIPDDATMVMHFDIKIIGGKIPAEDFRQSFMYRELMKKEGSPFISFLSTPEKSGIDLSAGIMLTIKYQGNDRYDRAQPIVHIFMKLQNAETFTKNIKELMKDDGEKESIKVYGTDRIISADGKMTAGWNNDIFVMTSGYSQEMTEEISRYYNFSDTTMVSDTATKPPFDIDRLMEKFKKSQRELCFQLLTPKTNGLLNVNPRFKDLMESKADIKTWTKGGSNPISENILPLKGILTKLQAFTGSNKVALINFEDGKIVMKSRNFIEGSMKEIYEKYPNPVQNTDLVRRLPQGKLLALINMSFSHEMGAEMIQKSGLMEMLDSFKKEIPLDISLAKDVFKSDMLLAVLKNDSTTVLDSMTGVLSTLNGFQVILAMPIADKTKFEKLKSAIMPLWDSLSKKEDFKIKDPSPVAKYNDSLLVLSLSEAAATAFLNNTGTGEVPECLTTYSQHPMVLDINMREIISQIMGKNRPERRNTGITEMLLNTFGDIVLYGGEYENESINTTMEFRIGNKNENSLKQLFNLMNASIEDKENRNISEEDQTADESRTITTDSVITLKEIIQEEKKMEPPPPPPPPVKPSKGKLPVKKYTPPVIKKTNK
jgi:hypothetical protein